MLHITAFGSRDSLLTGCCIVQANLQCLPHTHTNTHIHLLTYAHIHTWKCQNTISIDAVADSAIHASCYSSSFVFFSVTMQHRIIVNCQFSIVPWFILILFSFCVFNLQKLIVIVIGIPSHKRVSVFEWLMVFRFEKIKSKPKTQPCDSLYFWRRL